MEPKIREPPDENGLIALDCAPIMVQAKSAEELKPAEAARLGINGNRAGATTPVVELKKRGICLIAHENHPIMESARKFPANSQTTSRIPRYVNLADAIRYEFFLSDYDTILGREARRIFSKNGLQPITCNESLTALMAAALGAAGHGLAFTYYSSRHYFRDAKFLSLFADGASVRLATALPTGRYHSKAALALQDVLLKVLSDD